MGNEEDLVGCALWLISKVISCMDGKITRNKGGRLLILKSVTSKGYSKLNVNLSEKDCPIAIAILRIALLP